MTLKLIYTICFKPYNHDYYQLLGSNCELLLFSRKSCGNKCRLANLKDEDILCVTSNKIIGCYTGLSYSIYSKLTDIKFLREPLIGYKITGIYSSYEDNINWSWRRSSIFSSSWVLVDKNNKNKLLAKMEGFTLKLSYTGFLKYLPRNLMIFVELY